MFSTTTMRVGGYFAADGFHTGDFLLTISGAVVDSLGQYANGERVDYDLSDQVLVPPVSDAHVHGILQPWPVSPEERKGYVEPDLYNSTLTRIRQARCAGVGLLRDGGDPSGINLQVRQALVEEGGNLVYLTPGPALHSPGSYGSFIGKAVADRNAMQATVQQLHDQQVDFVKVLPTGIINFKAGAVTAQPQFDDGDLRYLVDICHGYNLRVMAHASGTDGIAQAVRCGVDYVEHGYFVDRPTLQMMAEQGIAWTPTFAPVWAQLHYAAICGWAAEVQENLRRILLGHTAALQYAQEIGLTIMVGSDAGAPGVDQAGGAFLEMELLQQSGMSAVEILQATCFTAPERLLGKAPAPWQPGAPARCIVAPASVCHDVRTLTDAQYLLWDGVILPYTRPKVRQESGTFSHNPVDNQLAEAR